MPKDDKDSSSMFHVRTHRHMHVKSGQIKAINRQTMHQHTRTHWHTIIKIQVSAMAIACRKRTKWPQHKPDTPPVLLRPPSLSLARPQLLVDLAWDWHENYRLYPHFRMPRVERFRVPCCAVSIHLVFNKIVAATQVKVGVRLRWPRWAWQCLPHANNSNSSNNNGANSQWAGHKNGAKLKE